MLKKTQIYLCLFLLLLPELTIAATNQYGETGTLSLATAETVGNGNLCVGLWGNYASMEDESSIKILPLSLTFGMTKDLELNFSFPNVYPSDGAEVSDRGYTNIGFKQRLIGTNRSTYKLAFSASVLKPATKDPVRSDMTDYEAKVLAGARINKLKLHLGAGYRQVEDTLRDDQVFFNGAIEYSPYRRFTLFLEGEQRSNHFVNGIDSMRITPGVQVYVTPHLTLSGGVDYYSSEGAPEWRAVAGISTCGGMGEYIVPIPKPPKPIIAELDKPKGKPPIPILPKMALDKRKRIEAEKLGKLAELDTAGVASVGLAPVSMYEVSLAEGEEDVFLPTVAMAGIDLVSPTAPALGAAPERGIVSVMEPEKPVKGRTLRKFRIPELMFDTGKWTIHPDSMVAVKIISEELMKSGGVFFVKVEGHTDSIGSEVYNEKLSLQRATSVARAMIENYGLPPERFFIEGYGEAKPIASNETEEGRKLNRRVDILLIAPEK